MNPKTLTDLSKFLSSQCGKPEAVGLELDSNGLARVLSFRRRDRERIDDSAQNLANAWGSPASRIADPC